MEHTTDSITNKKFCITDKNTYKILYTILIVVTIVVVGMFAINQLFDWYYKIELLYKPCDLCLKLNPNITLSPLVKLNFSNLTLIP